MITAAELRQKYLEFFKQRGHKVIPSAPLIPENDPTVLFTTAGMHPLVPYLLGEKHPEGKRLTDVQKCLRTVDIEEIGDRVHHTFFEMLGNWSLGDYFKKEAIQWSYEFLTSKEWLGISQEKLAVSVFEGDPPTMVGGAPRDDESAEIWKSLGIPEARIAYLPRKNNWWGPAGETGPCGPDTEMFYWTGKEPAPAQFDPEDSRWVEIWNDVFMEYNRKKKDTGEGEYEFVPLAQKNVDTGMGLERVLAVLNGLDDNYQTELFLPLIKEIEKLSGKRYEESEEVRRAMRIIADHLKAAIFILAERLEPSNVERGYVLRRLIRRAIRYGRQLGIKEVFCFRLFEPVKEIYQEVYPEIVTNRDFIEEQLVREEKRFNQTIERGLKIVAKAVSQEKQQDWGELVFDLYQSYGFPLELSMEELKRSGLEFSPEELRQSFEKKYREHQELSRQGSTQRFKGGLADHSEISKKYHTATHLLQAALRQILGTHLHQQGSNITHERLRFDFNHPDPISSEQLQQVEDLVNQKIQEGLPVHAEEMDLEEAKQRGALGVFEDRYSQRVKVYFIGQPENYFSIEICGGPHVTNTREIGRIKIVSLESIGQGIKRIRAVIEN